MKDDNKAIDIGISIHPDGTTKEIDSKDALPKETESQARKGTTPNNPWVSIFQELIRNQQKIGMYDATCSPKDCIEAREMSDRGIKQAIAGAEAVCNKEEFQGVRFTHQKKKDHWNRGYNLTVEFEW